MTIKNLIRLFEDRKEKLGLVMNDPYSNCTDERKARIAGAIDEIDFLLRTLRQNDEKVHFNNALGSTESGREYVFTAEAAEAAKEEAAEAAADEPIAPKDTEVREPVFTHIGPIEPPLVARPSVLLDECRQVMPGSGQPGTEPQAEISEEISDSQDDNADIAQPAEESHDGADPAEDSSDKAENPEQHKSRPAGGSDLQKPVEKAPGPVPDRSYIG